MKAYNDFRGFAAPAETVVFQDRRSPSASAGAEPQIEMHNARGLVVAVAMSVACWAGIGLAFLL